MEKRISRELAMVLEDLNQVAAAQRKRARRLECSLIMVGGLSLAALLAVLGTVAAVRPVSMRYEAITIELCKELKAHQNRCDTLLLKLGGDG